MQKLLKRGVVLTILSLYSCASVSIVRRPLSKPYTLKIPALLPIGGPIAPLGKLCTEPIELLLSIVNNRTDILPDYNVVFDVADDQCSDTRAISTILPFYLSGERLVNVTINETDIGQYFMPANRKIVHETAQNAYVAPFLVGGMCSGVCKVVSRYVQLFGVINFSASCNAGVLSNPKVYGNLFRMMSEMQVAEMIVVFLRAMTWSKFAIISDTLWVNFLLTNQTIHLANNNSLTVGHVEFYHNNEAAEAVARIKETGIRAIVAYCYFDTCPAIACEAYKQGLYGPRINWVFPGSTDFVNVVHPSGCSNVTAKRIEYGSFFMVQLAPDYKNTSIEVGLTGQDLDDFLEGVVPDLWTHNFVASRWNCFDSAAPSIFVLDSVERKLKAKGFSLREYIVDPKKKDILQEMMRQAIASIDIRTFSGRLRYQPGKQEVIVPAGFHQVQANNDPIMVFMDKGADAAENSSRFHFIEPIMWLTKDGKAPKNEPTLIIQDKKLPSWVGVIFALFASILILLAGIAAFLHFRIRHNDVISNGRPLLGFFALAGIVILLGTVIAFPAAGNMRTFCRVAPPMPVLGYSLLNGALLCKMTHKYEVSSRSASSIRGGSRTSSLRTLRTYRRNRNIRRSDVVLGIFIAWLLLNIIFCIIWYVLGGMPTTRIVTASTYDDDADIIWQSNWEMCSSESEDWERGLYLQIFAGAIVALQGACILSTMFLAVMQRRHGMVTEMKHTVFSVYVLFPAMIAAVLTVSMAETPEVVYCFLSAVVLVKCFAIMYLLFATRYNLRVDWFRREIRRIQPHA